MTDARDTLIGIDTTGAEYWLTPFPKGVAGNRMVEVRKSRKPVPDELTGMWTDPVAAKTAFEQYLHRKSSRTSKAVES